MSENKNQPPLSTSPVPGISSQSVIPHQGLVVNADQLIYDPDNTSNMPLDDEQHELDDDGPLIPLKK